MTEFKIGQEFVSRVTRTKERALADTADIAARFGQEILRCEVGSTAHGTGVEGTDDFDMMGIVVPPREGVLGLTPFEHYIYRTATERTGLTDAKSQPGDIDLTLYSLRKFAGLAKKGNPSILVMFFAPVLMQTELGQLLRASAHLFHSKESGYRFLGYMQSQRERLDGERGQKRCNRPDLVEQYGYDTKYAYHIIRLGIQGLEWITKGRISIPLPEHISELLVAIRTGQYEKEHVMQWASELENELKTSLDSALTPSKALEQPINQLIVQLHEAAWYAPSRPAILHIVQGDK
jgi:uncharacterized protein